MEAASPEVVSSSDRVVPERSEIGGGFGMVGIDQDDQMQLSRALFPGLRSPPASPLLFACHREEHHCYVKSQLASILPEVNNARGSVISTPNAFPGGLFGSIGHPYPRSSLMGWVDVSGNYTATGLPQQKDSARPSVTNLFSESVRPCNPLLVPTVPSSTLSPASASCSCMNLYNPECLEVMDSSNNESIGGVNSKKFRVRQIPRQEALQLSRQPVSICPAIEGCTNHPKDSLVLILQKELTKSDVGNVGRIVLPKKEAEASLPPLAESDGMLLHMDDMRFPVTWRFKYRFWPNNKSRMYVMEFTGDFVRAHGLQTGDVFNIYRNVVSGKYIVVGRRCSRPTTSGSTSSSSCTHQHCRDEDCNSFRFWTPKCHQEQESKCLGQSRAVNTAADGSFSMGFQTISGMYPSPSYPGNHPFQAIDLDNVSFDG